MTPNRSHLINVLKADIRQATGREYRVDWENMDELSIREMLRLLIDIKYEHQRELRSEVARARRMPWLAK